MHREWTVCKGVIAGEHDQVVIAWDGDGIFMVVPAHAIDWVMLAGADIQGDDETDLLFGWIFDRGRPESSCRKT
jgi:hypothetical protein